MFTQHALKMFMSCVYPHKSHFPDSSQCKCKYCLNWRTGDNNNTNTDWLAISLEPMNSMTLKVNIKWKDERTFHAEAKSKEDKTQAETLWFFQITTTGTREWLNVGIPIRVWPWRRCLVVYTKKVGVILTEKRKGKKLKQTPYPLCSPAQTLRSQSANLQLPSLLATPKHVQSKQIH